MVRPVLAGGVCHWGLPRCVAPCRECLAKVFGETDFLSGGMAELTDGGSQGTPRAIVQSATP